MELSKVWFLWTVITVLMFECVLEGSSQETDFQLPLQLVGFPFIIAAVRLTNFVKKMSYALSPATYRSRTRRELADLIDASTDAQEVENYIVGEFGERACVFDRECARYATLAKANPEHQLDFTELYRQYSQSPAQNKEFYLLSVFLGDIVASPELCHQLGKRRSCENVVEDTDAQIVKE